MIYAKNASKNEKSRVGLLGCACVLTSLAAINAWAGLGIGKLSEVISNKVKNNKAEKADARA